MSYATIANMATVDEASELIGLTKDVILAAIRRGDMPAKRVGRRYIVDLQDVEIFARRPKKPRLEAAVELHKGGYRPAAIARIMGIKRRSAQKLLNRAGVYFTKPHIDWTPERKREFIRVWNERLSVAATAAHFDITAARAGQVATELRNEGYRLRKLKRGPKKGARA